jgi:Na+-translocating ferredoxin:NAD+ oxidoreductase RnfD subunit
MTAPAKRSTAPAAAAPVEAPFLVWPVAQREFYASICLALFAPLAWGMVIFGWRILLMTITSILGASLVHLILQRFTRRGRCLVYAHSLLLALLLVALAHPQWPGWLVASGASLLPLISWILGGPGRERMHPSLGLVLLISIVLVPMLPGPRAARDGNLEGDAWSLPNAILARNRLFMGDIRISDDRSLRPTPLYRWPRSVDLAGDDALVMRRPDRAARSALAAISQELSTAELTDEGGAAPSTRASAKIRPILDDTLVMHLPGMDQVLLGAIPGQVGTVCIIGTFLAGLYLAYRNILRFRSAALFLTVFLLVQLFTLLSASAVGHLGIPGLWHLLREYAGELLTLWGYGVLSGDLLFAAVFVLALPGTEPLSSSGRRMFLIVAGLIAAMLHRSGLPVPAATATLTLLMPLRSVFDRLFRRRPWLDR